MIPDIKLTPLNMMIPSHIKGFEACLLFLSFLLPVHIRQHEINTSKYSHQIGHHEPLAYERNHLEMRKGWSSNANPVGDRAPIAYQIITVVTLCRLYSQKNLSGRYYRTPAYIEEMSDQGLDVMHRPFLERRSRQVMVRLIRA